MPRATVTGGSWHFGSAVLSVRYGGGLLSDRWTNAQYEGVMKTTNFTSPKHGAVTDLTHDELKAIAEHWKVDIKLD